MQNNSDSAAAENRPKLINKSDTVKEQIFLRFKARSDDWLHMFWIKEFSLVNDQTRELKIEQLCSQITKMYNELISDPTIQVGFLHADIYELAIKYNRTILNFRTGKKQIVLPIKDTNMYELSSLATMLHTTESNIFRICIFDILNIEQYTGKTVDILKGLIAERSAIAQQIDIIVKESRQNTEANINTNLTVENF
jgi:hypothetical protein